MRIVGCDRDEPAVKFDDAPDQTCEIGWAQIDLHRQGIAGKPVAQPWVKSFRLAEFGRAQHGQSIAAALFADARRGTEQPLESQVTANQASQNKTYDYAAYDKAVKTVGQPTVLANPANRVIPVIGLRALSP